MTASGKFFVHIVAVVLFMTGQSLQAQQDSIPKPQHSYIASYWHNGVALVTSPLHWKGDQWARAGSAVAITGLILSMDEPISQPFFEWQTNTGKAVGDVGYVIGGVPFQLGFTGLALGAGAIAHNNKLKNFALDNLQAQIFTGGITLIVKELSHRARPNAGEGAYAWYGPFDGGGNQSFFSGHSSLTFSTATMIFLHSEKKWWVGVLSYTVASGVAVSRMQRQAHWASDVVMGAIMGTAISSFIYKQQEKRRNPSPKLKTLP